MSITVVKRDGRLVPFDETKITLAISKALKCSPQDLVVLINEITSQITQSKISVEEIQDLVEKALINHNYADAAKAYILYRNERTKRREARSDLNKTISSLVSSEASDLDLKRENANIDGNAPMGIMLQFGSEVSKKFALENLIEPEQARAHQEGLIHIHDLNLYSVCFNCCQIPAGKLLKQGFSTGHGYIREPNSIQTAAALMCIIIQSNQNSMFGGQAIPLFEYDLAPYVMKSYFKNLKELAQYEGISLDISSLEAYSQDNNTIIDYNPFSSPIEQKIYKEARKLTEKQTYQAMEALIHNLNTMQSRAGAQTPFSSINYGTGTTPEQRLVIKSVLEATDAGMGSGETPIFPVQVFKVLDGTNTKKGDPNYDLFQLACKVSAKRLFPNFVFINAPYNYQFYKKGHPETEAAVMGCFNDKAWIRVLDTKTFNVSKVNLKEFVETYDYKNYRVWDSLSGAFVEILNVINNPETENFYEVKFETNQVLTVTEDHYFPLMFKGRTNVKDLKVGDILYLSHNIKADDTTPNTLITKITPLKHYKSKSYCLETTSDRFDVNGIVSNNCRTRVLPNIYDPEHQTPVGRGNIAFTTINLPKIALLSDKSLDIFFNKLDMTLKLCFNNLYDRFKYLSKKHAYNYPFLLSEGVWLDSEKLQPEDTIEEVLKQGTLAIGFCGLAECLVALIGKHHGESEEAQQLGLKIVGRIKSFCDQASQDTGLTWGAFASPAESAAGRFARINRKEFGLIKGVTDRDYITNGNHVPVYYPISASKKIEIEAPYHALCSAGDIAYVECNGDLTKNPQAFENIILYMKNQGICYGSINHPVDRCPVCGYVGIINDTCPKCGRHEYEAVSIEKLKSLGCTC